MLNISINERTRGNISIVLDVNNNYFHYLIAEWMHYKKFAKNALCKHS